MKDGDNLKKQGFIKGSVILIVSVIIVKIIGAMFKIPLADMLGGSGMGYFSSAYGLFMPVYAFFVTGMSAAAARQVAEYSALGKYKSIRKFKKLLFWFFSLTGIAGTLLIILTAKPFSYYVIQNEKAYFPVLVTAPSIFFGCIMSVYRGYYEGLRNMYPTAVSQVAEGISKLVLGLVFCMYILENYDSISPYMHGADRLSSAAAGAVAGITLSSAVGALYLILRDMIKGDGISEKDIFSDKSDFSGKAALKELLKVLIPVSVSSLVTNLTSLIDLGTIIRCINNAVEKSPQYFSENFEAFAHTGAEGFANFAYGSFIGLSVTVFNLVPSVTNMFGKGILPSAAEAWTAGDRALLKKHSEDVLKITSFIAVPSGLGITVLAEPVLKLLYPSSADEIQLAHESLSFLGVGIIFLALSFPVFSMLQGIGRADIPLKIMLAGVAVKFAGNMILVAVPQINISGAGISTDLCYLLILILSLHIFCKQTDIKINFIKLFFPSVYSGILCAVGAVLVYDRSSDTIISILCGAVVYIISIYLSDTEFIKSLVKSRK